MRLSLRNRLALLFFCIDCIAIAALYLYVAPGLQTRLLNQTLHELAKNAQTYSGRIVRTVVGPSQRGSPMSSSTTSGRAPARSRSSASQPSPAVSTSRPDSRRKLANNPL